MTLLRSLIIGARSMLRSLIAPSVSVARQAIGVSLLTTGSSTTDGTSIATASVDPADNAVIYAAIQYTATATTPTASGNGLTWVEVHTQAAGATDALTVFRALGAAPSAGAITFDFGATTQTSFVWAIVECTGVDTTGTNGSGATAQAVESTGASQTPALVLSELEHPYNVMLAFIGTAGSATITPDPDFAELMDDGEVTPSTALSAQWAVNQVACNPTLTASQTFAAVAIEVKAA